MNPESLNSILCVDDEPKVLTAMIRHLGERCRVVTASRPSEGLERLRKEGAFAVVVSDLRMPEMNGIEFLSQVRQAVPETVRILLTGHADLEASIAAVNEGNIFRLLTKPCHPEVFFKSIEAGISQYRLVTDQRVLLEKTLHGSIKVLCDALSVADPAAFGKANRVKAHVSAFLDSFGAAERWHVEVAAMLSQIGMITLPSDTIEKLHHHQPLNRDEAEIMEHLPVVVEKLLSSIPRLESVTQILRYQNKLFDGRGFPLDTAKEDKIPFGARVLKIVMDYDALESQGLDPQTALDTLRGRKGAYDPELLEHFARSHGGAERKNRIEEVTAGNLRVGMVLMEDMTTTAGMVLIPRGQEVNLGQLERLKNITRRTQIKEPIRVIVSGKNLS